MGRQHSFYHRKYFYKRNIKQFRPKFQVSLPLHLVYAKMIVSLPIQPIVLLKKSIQSDSLPAGWTLVQTENNEIIACLICHDSQQIPTVVSSLTISETLQYKVIVLGRTVNLPTSTTTISNAENFLHIITTIQNCNLCPGNNDNQFIQIAEQRKGKFTDRIGMLTKLYTKLYVSK